MGCKPFPARPVVRGCHNPLVLWRMDGDDVAAVQSDVLLGLGLGPWFACLVWCLAWQHSISYSPCVHHQQTPLMSSAFLLSGMADCWCHMGHLSTRRTSLPKPSGIPRQLCS